MKKLALLSLLSSGFISLQSFSGMVDLASAERYTIAIGSTNAAFGTLGLGSAVDIWGNVAASNNLTIGAGSIIRGDACSKYINADASVTITGDKNVAGQCANINKLDADIAAASQQAANLADQYVLVILNQPKALRLVATKLIKLAIYIYKPVNILP